MYNIDILTYMFNVQITICNNFSNRPFDEREEAMHTNQNETVHNDNTNIDERSSGIRTISLGTTKETNSNSTRNDSHSHTNNSLLTNEEQVLQNKLKTGLQMSSPARTISGGTTKVLFHLSMTTTMHLTLIKIRQYQIQYYFIFVCNNSMRNCFEILGQQHPWTTASQCWT